MKKILAEGVIRARDQNKVFVESVNTAVPSPIDVEDRYGLGRGRANAYIEFNIEPERLYWRKNPLSKVKEGFIIDDVNLKGRNIQAFFNF